MRGTSEITRPWSWEDRARPRLGHRGEGGRGCGWNRSELESGGSRAGGAGCGSPGPISAPPTGAQTTEMRPLTVLRPEVQGQVPAGFAPCRGSGEGPSRPCRPPAVAAILVFAGWQLRVSGLYPCVSDPTWMQPSAWAHPAQSACSSLTALHVWTSFHARSHAEVLGRWGLGGRHCSPSVQGLGRGNGQPRPQGRQEPGGHP